MKKKIKSAIKLRRPKHSPELKEAIVYNEMHDDHGPVVIGRREGRPVF